MKIKQIIIGFGIIFSFVLPNVAFGLITYDNSAASWDNTASLSFNLTVATSSTSYLVVACDTFNNRSITGVTYNGVAMSSLKNNLGTLSHVYVWGLANPTGGTNAVIASQDGSTHVGCVAASYAGVASTQPGTTTSSIATSATLVSATSTTQGANSWIISVEEDDDATGRTITSNPPQQQRQQITNTSGLALSDRPATTTGIYNAGFSISGTAAGNLLETWVELLAAATQATTQSRFRGHGIAR